MDNATAIRSREAITAVPSVSRVFVPCDSLRSHAGPMRHSIRRPSRLLW